MYTYTLMYIYIYMNQTMRRRNIKKKLYNQVTYIRGMYIYGQLVKKLSNRRKTKRCISYSTRNVYTCSSQSR